MKLPQSDMCIVIHGPLARRTKQLVQEVDSFNGMFKTLDVDKRLSVQTPWRWSTSPRHSKKENKWKLGFNRTWPALYMYFDLDSSRTFPCTHNAFTTSVDNAPHRIPENYHFGLFGQSSMFHASAFVQMVLEGQSGRNPMRHCKQLNKPFSVKSTPLRPPSSQETLSALGPAVFMYIIGAKVSKRMCKIHHAVRTFVRKPKHCGEFLCVRLPGNSFGSHESNAQINQQGREANHFDNDKMGTTASIVCQLCMSTIAF